MNCVKQSLRIASYIIDSPEPAHDCCIFKAGEFVRMTQLEVAYHYGAQPGEAEMHALGALREVYGIRKISFDRDQRVVRVEFDASRMKEPVISGLLRGAGIDLEAKLELA